MDIKEAMGYVQAVADNCNDAPRYQRALQTVLNFAEASYEEQNRLTEEIGRLNALLVDMATKIESLKQELTDERYRHDRYVDYSLGQDKVIDQMRDNACYRHGCNARMKEC